MKKIQSLLVNIATPNKNSAPCCCHGSKIMNIVLCKEHFFYFKNVLCVFTEKVKLIRRYWMKPQENTKWWLTSSRKSVQCWRYSFSLGGCTLFMFLLKQVEISHEGRGEVACENRWIFRKATGRKSVCFRRLGEGRKTFYLYYCVTI